MVSQNQLQKYAELAVRIGANVQKDQLLVITSSVDCAYFARLCVEEAYKAGAEQVLVNWKDEIIQKYDYQYASTETLADIAEWRITKTKYCIDRKCCYLHICSETPGILADIDAKKLLTVQSAEQKAFGQFQYYTMASHGQWSIVAIPTVSWAKKVFPEYDDEKALNALWDAVLKSVRITEDNDPVALWTAHNDKLSSNCKILNDYNFKSLHFKNSLGTDLTVELIKDHIWAGGSEIAKNGVRFNPNMPTEEAFTMPYKFGANGKVVATKPLDYQGKLVKDFWLEFKDGKVTAYGAKEQECALKNLVEFDEGSCYLGEVALIPYNSPINQMDILFLNTLFDENASCHLALGCAYPDCVKGGGEMKQEELNKLGSNYSHEHCDFMFGSNDMDIVGTTQDGKEVQVFKNGNFVF